MSNEPQPATPRRPRPPGPRPTASLPAAAPAPTDRQIFGRALRAWREERSVAQSELAELTHLDKSQISRIEAGERPVTARFADLCDRELKTGGALRRLLPAQRTARSRPTSLVEFGLPPAARLVGRKDELTRVLSALTADRSGTARAALCVVHGMPGAGKTALALRAGHELTEAFPDGLVYRDLGGDTEGTAPVPAADTLDWLLRHLGVDGKVIPEALDERAALFRGRIRGQRVLFVFDNVREADQVLPLIPAESDCAVLVVTRYRLASLADVGHVEVGPLTAEAAAELLRSLVSPNETDESNKSVESAPNPMWDAEIPAIARQCGFLPLALHIAAGIYHRRPHLGLGAVREHLDSSEHGVGPLTDGARSVAEIFQTALGQLREPENRLFELLSLHPGRNITPAVAAALTGAPYDEGARLLDALWDAHLLLPGRSDGYALHDLLRRMANDEASRRLTAADRRAALTRLAALYLDLADAADRLISPHRNRMPLPEGAGVYRAEATLTMVARAWAWLEDEEPVLVAISGATLAAGLDEYCWHLAHAMRGYFFHTSRCEPWIAVHENAVAAAEHAGDLWWEATSRNNLGLAYAIRREVEPASEQYARALAVFTKLGDEVSISHTLGHQAWIDQLRGDYESAVAKGTVALEVYRREGFDRNVAIMLREVAGSLARMGRTEDAARHLGQAITEFQELGLDLDLSMSLNRLAEMRLSTGELDSAVQLFREAKQVATGCDSPAETARALLGLGDAAVLDQRPQDARQLWTCALSLVEDLDLPESAALRSRLASDSPEHKRDVTDPAQAQGTSGDLS